ncbi:MAG: oligosaccharide flippase family protein [Ethanoligenens sp.]|uniref:lipopolysaccharide biosynthesis protein n=1 Tax=Ethanoligenens sp. TaxID=2099655 RepID=UPI0039E7E279
MGAKTQIQNGLAAAKQGIRRGFLHVFAGSTLVKLVSALSVLLLPNILTKNQYGALSVPDTFINYVLLFNDFGISNALLRYCAVREEPGERKACFLFGLRFGFLIDAVLIAVAAVVLFLLNHFGIYPIKPLEAKLLAGLMLWPVAQFLLDNLTYYFRAVCANKEYGRISLIFSVGYAVFPVLFALFLNVWGVVPGRYLGYIVALVAGFYMLRAMPSFQGRAVLLRHEEKVEMVKYGANQMLSSLFSQIMPIVEMTIVNLFVLENGRRGEFRIASLLPSMLGYMTISVIVFVFPYFAKHYMDGAWVWQKSKKLYLVLAAGMAVLIPLGILLTPLLVRTFFPAYNSPETIRVMQVFWAAYGVNAAFKATTGNILAALGEVKFNLIVTFFASVAQGVFCYILVSRFTLDGAAWGLLIAYSAYSLAGMVYLRYYCRKMIRVQAAFAHDMPEEEDEP